MPLYHVKFVGAASLAVSVATRLADAEGVELISSDPPAVLDDHKVELRVAVEGTASAVEIAIASIRAGIPGDAAIEIDQG